MLYSNVLSYRVYGKRALFTDPITKIGGEKMSYPIPTYQAIKGVTESIYWKPTIVWEIKRVRVLNRIQMESSGIRPIKYSGGGNDLAYYTYLKDVAYEVEVFFRWNENREDLSKDWNEDKHFQIAKRSIEKGGRRDIFLGTRECQAYVEPCEFGKGKGVYDEAGEVNYAMMFHSFIYPDEARSAENQNKLSSCFFNPVMKNGIIEFPAPEEVKTKREIYPMKMKDFILGRNIHLEAGYELD